MKPGGSIGLISCSTAGSPSGEQKSVFEQYVGVFPDCFIYGPTMPTLLPKLNLDKQGGFIGIEYMDLDLEVEGLVYNPNDKTIARQKGADTTDDLRGTEPSPQFKMGFRLGIIFTAVSLAIMSGVGLLASRMGGIGQRFQSAVKEMRSDKTLFPTLRRGSVRSFISGFFGSKTEQT